MERIRTFLQGKKTELLAASAIIAALLGVATGNIPFFEAVDMILLALFGTTLGARIKREGGSSAG